MEKGEEAHFSTHTHNENLPHLLLPGPYDLAFSSSSCRSPGCPKMGSKCNSSPRGRQRNGSTPCTTLNIIYKKRSKNLASPCFFFLFSRFLFFMTNFVQSFLIPKKAKLLIFSYRVSNLTQDLIWSPIMTWIFGFILKIATKPESWDWAVLFSRM